MPKTLTRNCLPFARRFRPRLLPAAIMAAGQALYSLPSLAAPEGGKVAGGVGTIEYNGEVTTIEQLSDRLAVDWDSFDVSADEVVNFLQPGAQSIALNRILSHNGSEILGQINANGRVVLVNPHGIVFGEGARVNVGGMLASGLDIGVDDFMAGDLTFSALEGAEGRVVNQGILQAATGGSVTLLGKQARNEGLISAHLGSINLAAGKEAVVTFDPEGLMGVRVTRAMVQDELGAEAALSNSGTLEAQGGQILLTASTSQELFSQAVNRGNQEQANSVVVHEDGSFTLGAGADVVNTGTLDVSSGAESAGELAVLGENITHSGEAHASGTDEAASGYIEFHAQDAALLTGNAVIRANSQTGEGGAVKVLGHKVGLMDQSLLDASGASGGGEILLGGDYKGGNVAIRNAWRTFVGPEASLTANALEGGDGGRIIVWADDITRYYGSLEGKGKGALGEGGFAEVSGKRLLDFDGTANLSGLSGAGTLLLDPQDIYIVDELSSNRDDELPVTDQNGDIVDQEETVAFENFLYEDVSFTSNKILDLLQGENGETKTNVILEATRDIFIEDSIVVTDEANTSNLTLKAGDDIWTGDHAIKLGAGDLRLYAGMAECGGSVCLNGVTNDGNREELPGHSIKIGGELETAGEIILRAADNVAVIKSIGEETSPSVVSVRAGNSITVDPFIGITAAANPSLETISLVAGDSALTSNVREDDSHHIQLVESDASITGEALTINGTLNSNGGNISLYAPGAVTLTASPETGGGDLFVGAEAGRVGSFDSTGASLNTTSSDPGGNITIYSQGNTNLGGASGFGGLTVDSESGNITLNGDYRYKPTATGTPGLIDLKARSSSGNVSLVESYIDNESGSSGLDVVISSGGSVSVSTNTYGIYLLGGEFRVNESGSIEIDQQTFNTEGGAVNLNSSGLVNIKKTIETGGASLTVTGEKITSAAPLIMNGTSTFTATSTDGLGDVIKLNGDNKFNGTVNIDSSGGVTLVNNAATRLGTADINGSFNLTSLGDVISTGAVTVDGTSTFTVTNGVDEHYGLELTNVDNSFVGKVSVGRASNVDLYGKGTLEVGNVSTTGEENAAGGDITLKAGNLTVGALEANAGPRNGWNDGSDSGAIVLEGTEAITLTNHLLAQAHSGEGWNRADGTSGGITLTGNVVLEADAAVTGPLRINTQMLELEDPTGSAGAVTFSASLDSADGTQQGLQIDAGTVTFSGAIGESVGLGALSVNALGDVTLGGSVVPAASSILISGQGDAPKSLTATDTVNEWTLNQNANDEDSANRSALNTLVKFTGFDTLVGGSKADHFSITFSGANFALLNGVSATGNQVTAAGDWSVSADGTGSILNSGNTTAFSNIQTLNGGGGSKLQGPDGANTWTVTGPNAGEIQQTVGENETAFYSFDFTGMNTLIGGDGNDDFIVNGDATIGTLRGFAENQEETGSNTLKVNSSQNQSVAWSVASDNSGSVVTDRVASFYDISSLEGDEGADTFTVTSYSGDANFTVDGGASGDNNTFSFGGVTDAVTLSIGGDDEPWSLSNVQEVVGNSNAASTLKIASGTNTWTLNDENSGTLEQTGTGEDLFSGVLTFSNFANLTGGDGNDSFIFITDEIGGTNGTLTGSLSGGDDGTDTLTGRNGANLWSLGTDESNPTLNQLLDNTDSENAVVYLAGFSNIDKLQGGTSSDIFQFGNGAQLVQIDGGSAVGNRVDFSQKTEDVTITIGSGELGGIDNIQGFIGNAAQGATATLAVVDGNNRWDLVALTKESSLESSEHGSAIFSGFNVVRGGSGKDDFELTVGENFLGTVDGGAGSDNTLTLTDGTNTWALTGVHGGNVDGRIQTFENIQTLIGADDDTLIGRSQNNAWELDSTGWSVQSATNASDSVSFSGMSVLKGNSFSDTFTIAAEQSFTGTLDGGSGTGNTLAVLTVEGGSNTWTLSSAHGGNVGSRVQSFSNIQTLTGAGNDTLVGRDQNNTWVLDGAGWSVQNTGDASDLVRFSGMGILQGNSREDAFTIGSGQNFTGTLDGVSATGNSLSVAGGSSTWTLISAHGGNVGSRLQSFSNIQTLTGAGDDTLVGRDQNNTWVLDGTGWSVQNTGDASDLVRFSGMDILQGNSQEDAFTIASGQNFTGTLDGVSATGNTLTVEGGPNTWRLTSAHGGNVGSRLQSFSNIQTLTGAGDDTLVGRDQNNSWVLNGSGWSVQNAGGASDRVSFSGMGILQGNSREDAFTIGSGQNFTGTLDGVSATGNSLTVEGGPNTWRLTSAHGGNVGSRLQNFANIQTLTGTGADTLVGRNQNNVWMLNGSGNWSVRNADNASDLISFSGMSALEGNTQADDFTLAANQTFTGTLDGVSSSGNTLTVEGGSNRWVLSAEQQGAVTNSDGTVTRLGTFSHIQTLQGTGFDEVRGLSQETYWHSDTNGTWTLANSEVPADRYLTVTGMNRLVGGSDVDTFTLASEAQYTGTLNGGTGNGDTLTVVGGNSQWRVSSYGTDGGNGWVASRLSAFEGIDVLTGAGTDRLEGPNQANNWSLTGADTGTLSASNGIGASVHFSGMSVLLGGNARDAFASSGSATVLFSGVIDGSVGGEDELDLTALAGSPVTVGMLTPDNSASDWQAREGDGVTIRNIETLRADSSVNNVNGSEGNRLLGPLAGDYTWTLTAENSGKVEPVYGNPAERTLSFFGFEYLEGGAGKNDFVFNGGDVTGGISGGSGEAWLDYSLRQSDLCINLLSGNGGCSGPTLSGIAGVIGNGGETYNSQLRLNVTGVSTWTIKQLNNRPAGGANDGVNDGEVQADGQTIAFIDFNQLVGGSGEDTFRFDGVGQVTGYIDGRGESDVVTSVDSSKSLAFRLRETLAEGSHASGVWLKQVETITANAGNGDQLIGEQGGSTWVVDGENRGHINDNAITFSGIGSLWGGSGVDTFTIEQNGSLVYGVIGGDGTASDRLSVNSETDDPLTWSVTGAGQGSADRAGSFEGIEVLGGGQGDDHFTLAGATAWVDSLLGGSGNNTVSYEADATQPVSATWTLSGGQNGSVTLGDSENAVGFTAIGDIEGAGSDHLIASDATNDWSLSSAKGGTLQTTTASGSQTLMFDGMVTLQGSARVDHFTLGNGVNFAGTLLGENGNDEVTAGGSNTWTLSATGAGTLNEVTHFEGIQTLNGGGENNELIAPERNNRWRLIGDRSGTLDDSDVADSRVAFTGMDTLTGNRLRDIFVATTDLNRQELGRFAALSGGAGAGDSLNLSNLTQAITLSLGQPEDGQESEHGIEIDSFVSGFETLDAANQANHLLGASDRAYRWVVTGVNRGRVEQFEGNSAQTTVAFSNFSRLTGGSASDTFAILDGGDTSGVIDGGDGINLVDYSLKTEDVNVTFGGLDEDIRNISGVIGNNGGSGDRTSRLLLGETNETSIWRIGSIADIDQSCAEGCQNDGVNDGQVTLNGESLYFIDFNILEGGAGEDTFNVVDDGRFIGSLKGGVGADTLNIADAGSVQSVGLGESSRADTHLVSVETLIGSNDRQHTLYGTSGPDAANNWLINANGGGTLNGDALAFTGMQVLHGGSDIDKFVIIGEGKAHTLNAGAEAEGNTVDISGASEALWLSLDTESAGADIRLVGMDELIGNRERAHRLESDNRPNRWSIDARNGGTLNEVLRFSGLTILQGNNANDVFTFTGAGRLDGHINGGGGGDNRVDLSGLAATEQWTIATTAEAPADLNVVNIQTLDGGSEGEHTLLGTNADNQWTVTNTNSGTLENLKFTGVANLMGGTGKDDVVFDVAGELSGYIDGGAGTGQNTVDFSKKTTAVAVSVGTDQGDLRRFDQLTGNNRQTTLTGLDDDNRWRLDSGENTGYLNDRLKFSGVTDLVGGDGGNTFSLNGGLVTGLITGGSGEDRFDLVLRPDAQGQLELNAVEGHDELWVSGGASGSRVEYFARRNAAERLTYTGDNNQVFEVAFEGVERVQDDVTASELRINTSLEADTLSMENNGIQVNGLAQLDYNNKTDLTLAANSDDTVELTGAVAIPGRLEIRNAKVQQATQERLKARELHLVGVGEFGTPGGAIYTDIDALYADVGQGGLALNNGGVLNLAQLNSLGATAIYSAGNITSTADLSAAGELLLRSDLGGIRLEGDNRFSGTTHLEAAHEIQLHHDRDLTLGRVSGDTLKLVNQGDVIGQGAWDLNTAVFSLEGDLSALNADNRLGMLRVERAGNVALLSDSALNVGAVESGGDVDLSANGLTLESLLNAENLTLNAGEGTLHVDGAVDIEQRLEANASAVAVNQTLTAGAMVLDAGEGALEVNATLRADSAEGVSLAGGTFTQNARINSAGTIAVNARESLQQRAELTASAGIELVSGGELTMSRGARSTTEAGAIRYQAGDNLTVSYLDNTDGTIALVSDRRIETAIGEEVGLRSQRIEFEAVEGIGTQTSLAVQTKELHATNEGGNVALTNNGALRIERLATNGDIIFRNEGTVELDNRNGPVFDQASNDAIEAGGIGNANYDLGRVSLTVANGNLVALGPIDARKPDFVGLRGNFLVGGDIGSPVRPLVLYFKESLVLNGTRSWRPYWGFNDAPDTFENNSEIPVSQDLMNAGEQLVEVESLEEIDPAIFTEVRNYTYDEVSILMPPDQRYGDEDDEQRYSADY